MEVSVLISMMSAFFDPADAIPRRRSFTSVSVITGHEVLLRTTALPKKERRIAAYRKSPESRLLRLDD